MIIENRTRLSATSIQIGKIKGIPIKLHITFLLVLPVFGYFLVYNNPDDPNNPITGVVPTSKDKEITNAHELEVQKRLQARNMFIMLLVLGIVGYSFFVGEYLLGIIAAVLIAIMMRQFISKETALIPKLLVSNSSKEAVPYIDATGAHTGALLGDVRPDHFRSRGLETPAHDLKCLSCGAIVEPIWYKCPKCGSSLG